MKVKALRGFVSTIDGEKYRVEEGQEVEMPKAADWLKAGLVEKAESKTAPKKRKAS